MRIISLDDKAIDRLLIASLISRAFPDATLFAAESIMQLKSELSARQYDCLILDIGLPDGDGLTLLQEIRRDKTLKHLAVIMLTGIDDTSTAVRAMKWGATDFLPKFELNLRQLQLSVKAAIEQSEDQRLADLERETLRSQALRDPLTGLSNRRAFVQLGLELIARRTPFALLTIDLNKFKAVNDALGHGAGDAVLSEISSRLRSATRRVGEAFRVGGDEFCILLPLTQGEAQVSDFAIELSGLLAASISVCDRSCYDGGASIGVAIYPNHGIQLHDLECRSDLAMYAAKRSARSFVIASPDDYCESRTVA